MDSRSFVRPFVSHTSYLENRASDFHDFLHKATSWWVKKKVFDILAKMVNFWPFLAKNRFLDILFESAHRICLKHSKKLGTVVWNHSMAVLFLGKFLFWPFFGQKYIACGDVIWFWAVFGHFLPSRWCKFYVNFCCVG